MKIEREKLKRALEIVKPGLSNKDIIEQSTSFAFMDGFVVTYNDEISIKHPIESDLQGAIKADELYKFISRLKATEIEIESDGNLLLFKCGRIKAGFQVESKIKLPLNDGMFKKGKWKTLPDKFIEYLKFSAATCSQQLTLPKLTCVHVCKDGYIESSDSHRIFRYNFENEFGVESFLLPQNSANIVAKYNVTKITETEGWVHFKTDEGTIISCRTFNDTFVDTDQYLKQNKKGGKKITFPANLKEILDRAVIFTEEENIVNSYVDIGVEARKIIVKSKSETAWFEESSRIKYEGEPISFTITAKLMIDILSLTNECILLDKLLHFTGENWVYITALHTTA